MNERLRDHYVGEYEILLENISLDGRLVSGPGVGLLVASINETGGFLPQYAPLVVVDSADIPEEGFNAEIAETTSTRVLDGAVRVTACFKSTVVTASCFAAFTGASSLHNMRSSRNVRNEREM